MGRIIIATNIQKKSIKFNINGDEVTDFKSKQRTGKNIFKANAKSADTDNAGVVESTSGTEGEEETEETA